MKIELDLWAKVIATANNKPIVKKRGHFATYRVSCKTGDITLIPFWTSTNAEKRWWKSMN